MRGPPKGLGPAWGARELHRWARLEPQRMRMAAPSRRSACADRGGMVVVSAVIEGRRSASTRDDSPVMPEPGYLKPGLLPGTVWWLNVLDGFVSEVDAKTESEEDSVVHDEEEEQPPNGGVEISLQTRILPPIFTTRARASVSLDASLFECKIDVVAKNGDKKETTGEQQLPPNGVAELKDVSDKNLLGNMTLNPAPIAVHAAASSTASSVHDNDPGAGFRSLPRRRKNNCSATAGPNAYFSAPSRALASNADHDGAENTERPFAGTDGAPRLGTSQEALYPAAAANFREGPMNGAGGPPSVNFNSVKANVSAKHVDSAATSKSPVLSLHNAIETLPARQYSSRHPHTVAHRGPRLSTRPARRKSTSEVSSLQPSQDRSLPSSLTPASSRAL
ncbi:hypothetical protein BDK51DRAFT_50111 [Blyttiomyces helicus]|uniref:Uncharacterized protein n=1 Tax=Blyttiomyces helicus TaxID=388810 RepID=A0A4P9VUK3_9FUNG|nr:hypothetical protein BDK51DRAFT_50111 [Blyttiomyces helicus]|eukprot:RKO83274.1 hypothetical protein BDK51DRAFT_50111 [Blyttiomyces helicus]